MDASAIDTGQIPQLTPAQTVKLRDVAKQFEAILLTQLTSSLNNIGSDEDSLFGQDGGADLAKKMFSEQLATAMSEAGGIGIADSLLREFGIKPSKAATRNIGPASLSKSAKPLNNEPEYSAEPVIYRSGKTIPVSDPAGDSNDLGIVSTDVNDNANPSDESWRNPFISPGNGIDYTDPANMKNPQPAVLGYSLPAEGRISSRFGNRFHPIDRIYKFHGGIDIAAPRGAPIQAAADGVVVFAGRRGSYGNMVIIQHADGRLTRYAHAESISVVKDQKVSAGENIATVGSTGKATGPHLHFEVREDGKSVNPFGLLTKVSNPRSDM